MTSESAEMVSGIEALMWDVYGYVREGGGRLTEGGASAAEATYLRELARRTGAPRVAEIGFNVGFSALAFLDSAPEATVVSFELDRRWSVELAKEYVDNHYPGRHELVIGDSTVTVPDFAATRDDRFDLVFVDGGHTYEVAAADIANARAIAKPGAVVVVDDLIPWYPWGVGPHRAWQEAVESGLVHSAEYYIDGHRVDTLTAPGDRAWGTAHLTI
ncbi:O-methyltransferase [Alloactinosynnema sp. L-07]|uniref:O-methyltransferase n=1 Tax=Alloactinosynnema sp. L-07 TaxID=1653480 RepID=UPI0006B4FEC0|nr:class I SAM-dependent methyltransferase [Alloactinosynnema sp. L-07]